MIFGSVVSALLFLLNACVAIAASPSLFGKIVGIPSDFIESQRESLGKPSKVLNGVNYQSRIKASLIPLKSGEQFEIIDAPLNKNFEFSFDHLSPGKEYHLVVNSYDFHLDAGRYRVIVDEEGVVRSYIQNLNKESYNSTSEKKVGSASTPLLVKVGSIKEYYEVKLGGIGDMIMSSPFGFIFANTMYTILFGICTAIIIAPYVLSWVAPDFASEFEEASKGGDPASQGASSGAPEAIQSSGGGSTGANAGRAMQNARQRK